MAENVSMIGYTRVSKADGRQVHDLQCDALIGALMPDFDPRTYGCPKLLTLKEKSDAFEVRRENLKVCIRAKQTSSPKAKQSS
jgi:hypothetical protein